MTYINKIEITAFGKFKGYSMEFDKGYNEFIFNNEFGKSTITDFIIFMLYGFVKTQSKKITLEQNYLKKYIPWDGEGKISGALELEKDGEVYRIERFQRETGTGSFTVRNAGGSEISIAQTPGQYFYGVDCETFLRTYALRQADMNFFKTDGIETALKNLVTTGDEDISYDAASEILRKKKAKYQHGDRHSGRIFDIPKEISAIDMQIGNLKREIDSFTDSALILSNTERQIADCDKRIDEFTKEIENACANDAARKMHKIQSINPAIEECKQKLKLKSTFDKQTIINAKQAYENFEVADIKVCDSQKEYEDAKRNYNQQISSFPEYSKIKENQDKIQQIINSKGKTNLALLLAGIVLMASAVGLGFLSIIAAMVVAISGAILTVLAFIIKKPTEPTPDLGFTDRKALIEAYNKYQQNKGEIELSYALMQKAEQTLIKDTDEKQKLSQQCVSYGFESKEHLLKVITDMHSLEGVEGQLERLEKEKSELLSGITEQDLSQNAKGGDIHGPSEAEIKANIFKIKEQKQTLISKYQDMSKIKSKTSEYEKEIYLLNQKKQQLEKELNEATYQNEVLDIAISTLNKAYEKISNEFSPILGEKAKESLTAFTDGKYKKIYLDKDFEIRIQSEEGTKDLGYFSKGTREAVYFAVRQAASELMSGNANLPLVLDDPFWSLDSKRLESAREHLKKIANQKQIIVFGAR